MILWIPHIKQEKDAMTLKNQYRMIQKNYILQSLNFKIQKKIFYKCSGRKDQFTHMAGGVWGWGWGGQTRLAVLWRPFPARRQNSNVYRFLSGIPKFYNKAKYPLNRKETVKYARSQGIQHPWVLHKINYSIIGSSQTSYWLPWRLRQ